MSVWDTATPAGTDPISQGDDRIREMKLAIQDALRAGEADGDEAIFPGASPSTDPIFRPRGGYGVEASRPAAAVGGLYYNTTVGALQRSNGTTWDNLDENAAYEAIHAAASISLASSSGVVTLTEAGNAFHVSGTEAVTQIAGWSAGIAIVRWTQARTLTHNGTSFILANAANRTVAAGDVSTFQFVGSNQVREIGFYGAKVLLPTIPTRTVLTSGTAQTYTTPSGVRLLKIRMVGGGGGGGAAGGTAGGAGGTSRFDTLYAVGGDGGMLGSGLAAGPAAGGSGGSGTAELRISGGYGGGSGGNTGTTGGKGGESPFGGAGAGAGSSGYAATAGRTNSGSGGGGGNNDGCGGSGGGAGEYLEGRITSPAEGATYTYTVGAAGAASTGGTVGGAGGSGVIIVDEVY